MHKTLRLALGLAALLGPSPALAQAPWEAPPRNTLQHPFRGYPVVHGEFSAAAVACGIRSPEWAARYRALVDRRARQLAASSQQADETISAMDAFAAYGRRRAQANRAEYCKDMVNPVDLQAADDLLAGRRRLP